MSILEFQCRYQSFRYSEPFHTTPELFPLAPKSFLITPEQNGTAPVEVESIDTSVDTLAKNIDSIDTKKPLLPTTTMNAAIININTLLA